MPLSDLWQWSNSSQSSDGQSAERHSSSDESDVGGSDGSTDSSNESPAADPRILRRQIKRQKQTAKGRAAALKVKAMKKLGKQASLKPPDHPAERFRNDRRAKSEINRPGCNNVRLRRLRLLCSYMKGWCQAVMSFFDQVSNTVEHTILVSVVDDTNVRLSEIPCGATGHWRVSRVVSVMNNIQSFVVGHKGNGEEGGDRCHHKWFLVPTPMICLPKSDRNSITSAFMSRLLCFLGKVPDIFCGWELLSDLTKMVPIQCVVLMFDSLKSNLAMLKLIREAVHLQRQNNTADRTLYPMFAQCCLLHQLSLARNPLLLGFGNFWSSVVRLGHLFENQNFRKQFRASMVHVLCESFACITVVDLPIEAFEWREQRNAIFGQAVHMKESKRSRIHRDLATWDNGDSSHIAVTHWCRGSCCVGQTAEAKQKYALTQICKYYTLLFGFGFPVPLLYRWVHAQRANEYVKETWLVVLRCQNMFLVSSVCPSSPCFRS